MGQATVRRLPANASVSRRPPLTDPNTGISDVRLARLRTAARNPPQHPRVTDARSQRRPTSGGECASGCQSSPVAAGMMIGRRADCRWPKAASGWSMPCREPRPTPRFRGPSGRHGSRLGRPTQLRQPSQPAGGATERRPVPAVRRRELPEDVGGGRKQGAGGVCRRRWVARRRRSAASSHSTRTPRGAGMKRTGPADHLRSPTLRSTPMVACGACVSNHSAPSGQLRNSRRPPSHRPEQGGVRRCVLARFRTVARNPLLEALLTHATARRLR